MGFFQDWLNGIRERQAAKVAAGRAKAEQEAAERNANTARVTEQQRNEQALRDAERKRVQAISERGGVPPIDPRAFEVVEDVEATLQAVKKGEPSPMRYRQKYPEFGNRKNLTGAQLPRIDTTAWHNALQTRPDAPLADFWYWP